MSFRDYIWLWPTEADVGRSHDGASMATSQAQPVGALGIGGHSSQCRCEQPSPEANISCDDSMGIVSIFIPKDKHKVTTLQDPKDGAMSGIHGSHNPTL